MALTWIRTHDWDSDAWRNRAACRDTSPELFFPIGTTGVALDQIEAAKRVCSQCPVTGECLEFALGDQPGSRRLGRPHRRGAPSGPQGLDRDQLRDPRQLARRTYNSTRGIATRTRTHTDVPPLLCISIDPSSSPVTSACTIDRPRP